MDKTFGALFFLLFVLGIIIGIAFFRTLPGTDFAILRNGNVHGQIKNKLFAMTEKTGKCKNCKFWEYHPKKDFNGGWFNPETQQPERRITRYGKCKADHIWNVEGEGFIRGDNIQKVTELADTFKKYRLLRKYLYDTTGYCAENYGCIHFEKVK